MPKQSRRPSTTTVVDQLTQLTATVGANRAIAPMIVPPDGGWGWIVVVVCTLSIGLCDGITYCVYIFREPMSRDLHCEQAQISYLSSLNTGFYFIGAVFGCSFINHWGFRITMVVGATVTALCYTSGYFFHDIIYYLIIIGVISGMSSGFISMAANLPPGFYFDKKRSVAFGIVSCGSGIGGTLLPVILQTFMNQYGWRYTYIFEGGLILTTLFLGLLIRPLKPVMVVIDVESSQRAAKDEGSLLDLSEFMIPADAYVKDSMSMRKVPTMDGKLQKQQTIADMADDLSVLDIKVHSDKQRPPPVVNRLQQMVQSRRSSPAAEPVLVHPSASTATYNYITITQEPTIKQRLPWYQCGCCRSKKAILPGRALMRDDILYTGNLRRLPEYTQRDRDLEYHLRVTRVPTYVQFVEDLVSRTCSLHCFKNVFTGLRYLFDYTMLKYFSFYCLAFCGFGTYMAFYVPYIFLKVHLDHFGEGGKAAVLVSLIGFGSMIGRLSSGVVVTACPKFDARTVLAIMSYVGAASIAAVPLFNNIYAKAACLFINGAAVGYYTPLKSLVLVDYFGLQKLTSGTGVLIICLGFGSLAGPVVGQNAMQYTNSTGAPFYVGGICLLFSGLALFPMDQLSKWDKKREEKKRARRPLS